MTKKTKNVRPQTKGTKKMTTEKREASTQLNGNGKDDGDIIELPPMDPVTVETFRFDASRIPAMARAIVGEGPGWQRRFGRLVGLSPSRVTGAVVRARRGHTTAVHGAPAVRCALLARRLDAYAVATRGGRQGSRR